MKKNNFFKNRFFLFTLLFAIIFLIGYSPLIIKNYSLVWNVDGVGQYYPAFIYTGKYLQNFIFGLFHGKWILPAFDLSIGMGEDIIGSLNYYGFGDPLNLLAIFVTKNNSAFLFSMSIVLKMWLSGISLLFYFRHFKFGKLSSTLGSLCYVFCGFSIFGGTCYAEWLSVLIYTPLILLGVEKIISQQKYLILILSICYGGLCGFYFLFMASLLLGVYLPLRLIFKNTDFKTFCYTVLKSIYAYLLGLLLSAPFFLPSVYAYFNSERQTSGILEILMNKQNYIPHLNFNFGDYLANPFYTDSPYLSGILMLEFLSLILLLFLPNNKKKTQCVLFFIIGFIAYVLPITGYIFNGFGQPYSRWVFILHLLFAGIFVFVIDSYAELFFSKPKHSRKKKGSKGGIVIATLLTLLVICNISINLWGLYSDFGYGWTKEFIKYDNAKLYTDSPYTKSKLSKNQSELYRVSTDQLTGVNGRPENIAMLNNYNGLTYWFSIINKNTQSLVDNYNDGNHLNWRSYGFGASSTFNTMYGVKYYLSKNEINEPNNYQLVDTVNFNNEKWHIYENKHFHDFSFKINKEKLADIINSQDPFKLKMDHIYANSDNRTNQTLYQQDKFIINNSSKSDKNMIVLPIPYSKNWQVTVDGKKVPIDTISKDFMSVPINKDTKKVVFVYKNKMIFFGLICFVASLILSYFFIKNKPTSS